MFNTAYSAYSARIAARAARILGKDADAEKYEDAFAKFRAAFRRAFVRADGSIESDTQTAYILAYAFGLMGEEVRPHLLRAIKAKNYHLTTGFAGVRYALSVLCDLGCADVAYRIATCTSFPSWGYSIISGATTVWERWDSLTRFYGAEVLADASMNSFNHYSLGSAAEWLYSCVLGIRPAEEGAGFRRVEIRPIPDRAGYLTHASGSYDSVNGKIEARWERVGGVIAYTFEKPAEMHADFRFDRIVKIEQDGKVVKTFDPYARKTTVIVEV